MTPLEFTFIMPMRDQVNLTRDCLLSWFAYTRQWISCSEMLLVDDGGDAETHPFLENLPSPIRVIRNPENLGFAKSNNIAAAQARGKYIVLLNNDLVLQSAWLDTMLRCVTAGSTPRVVGNVQLSRITREVDHVGKFFDVHGEPRHFGQFYKELFPWVPAVDFLAFPSVTAACWLLKREVFQSLGGFDESYQNGFEDDDFCLRAREQGVEVGVALNSRIYHHVSVSMGRKSHEDVNRTRFLKRWGDWTKNWHTQHFETMLLTLKSWSCSP